MTEPYNATVAAHYAAYRPPLHQRILKRALIGADSRSDALDVGCGTGCSSVALTDFCDRVYAIDPSQSMLDAAKTHHAITYLKGSGENIPLPDCSIDIVTFAGSLWYANPDATARELCRVCRHDAYVIPYDFHVLIDCILQGLGIATQVRDSTYDHGANFSGVPAFRELLVMRERIEIVVRATDLAHVLLADAARHDAFVCRYKTTVPHRELAAELGLANQQLRIEAEIFYSQYQISDELKARCHKGK